MRRKITRKRTHPGEALKELYMKPLKLSVTALSACLGVSRKTLSTIVNERAGISPDMALRLSRAFTTTPELWLNMQQAYDLWLAENEHSEWRNVTPVYMPGSGPEENPV